MDAHQLKAMEISNLQARLAAAQQRGDAATVADCRSKLAIVAGAARSEQRRAIQTDTKNMQYKFGKG